MTRRETILQAIVAALATIPGLTVLRYPPAGGTPTTLDPVAVVRPVTDIPDARKNDQQDRVLNVAVTLITHGETAEADADSFCEAVHAKICSTPFLGAALNIAAGPVNFLIEPSDAGSSSSIQSLFAVSYRVRHSSLTT